MNIFLSMKHTYLYNHKPVFDFLSYVLVGLQKDQVEADKCLAAQQGIQASSVEEDYAFVSANMLAEIGELDILRAWQQDRITVFQQPSNFNSPTTPSNQLVSYQGLMVSTNKKDGDSTTVDNTDREDRTTMRETASVMSDRPDQQWKTDEGDA